MPLLGRPTAMSACRIRASVAESWISCSAQMAHGPRAFNFSDGRDRVEATARRTLWCGSSLKEDRNIEVTLVLPHPDVPLRLAAPDDLSAPGGPEERVPDRQCPGWCLVSRHSSHLSRDIVHTSTEGGGRCRWDGWWSRRSRSSGRSKSEVARDYRVSRRWVHEIVRRYEAEGEAGLEPRSRRPLRSPHRTLGLAGRGDRRAPQGALGAGLWTPAPTRSPTTWSGVTGALLPPPRSGGSSPAGASSHPSPRNGPALPSSGSRPISPTNGGRPTSPTGSSWTGPKWRS